MIAAVSWQQRYLARFYDPGRGWVDGTTEFHRLCAAHITAGSRVLELGAGRSNPTSRFLATRGALHGLDPDAAVLGNDALQGAQVLEGPRFPLPDASFDACASNFVLEHVRDPRAHFDEVRRVLRPGGCYVLRTANRYHYVTVVSRFTPHSFHRLVVKRLTGAAADAPEPFPTAYAANSPGRLRALAAACGLEVESLHLVEKEPSYGMASRLMFLAFTAYERAVNASGRLAILRSNIFGVLRRPA